MAYKDSELVFIYLLSLLCTRSMQQYNIIVKCIRLQNSNMTQGSEYTYFYCGPMAGITRGCDKPPYAYCRTEESIKTLPVYPFLSAGGFRVVNKWGSFTLQVFTSTVCGAVKQHAKSAIAYR